MELDKADVLVDQFTSVFTVEPHCQIPVLDIEGAENQQNDIVLSVEDIAKRLINLNINKAMGRRTMNKPYKRTLTNY